MALVQKLKNLQEQFEKELNYDNSKFSKVEIQ
jgi:hypothetical protein